MKALILCPGPSLRAYLANPVGGDVVIAVNRAAEAVAADWLCAIDADALLGFRPEGRPRIFTTAQSMTRFRSEQPGRASKFSMLSFEALYHQLAIPRAPRWDMFSATAALVLAHWLGASEIEIFGCDWRGENDWDGTPPGRPGSRSISRWKSEQHKFHHIASALSRLGCTIRRHTLEESEHAERVCAGV